MLEKLKPTILEKLEGKNFRFPVEKLEVPPREMLVEVVVDDECEICPIAIEFLAEVASRYRNIKVVMYNATYVQPSFEIDSTPTFRINEKVQFSGIPIFEEHLVQYFSYFLREAYVITHPKLNEVLSRIEWFAKKHGYKRCPNDEKFIEIIYKLLKNLDLYGYPYCPCRPLKIPRPDASLEEIYEANRDKVCPCQYVHMDVKKFGHCLCALFWSEEKVNEYINERIKKYGYLIKDIEKIEETVRELKKRVITGRGRLLAESIIRKLEKIYSELPD